MVADSETDVVSLVAVNAALHVSNYIARTDQGEHYGPFHP